MKIIEYASIKAVKFYVEGNMKAFTAANFSPDSSFLVIEVVRILPSNATHCVLINSIVYKQTTSNGREKKQLTAPAALPRSRNILMYRALYIENREMRRHRV